MLDTKINKRNLIIWLGWIISLGFIVWAMSKMDLGEVWTAITYADYRWVIPMAIVNIFTIYLRGARWANIILPIKDISTRSSFSAISIGCMANMLLPARMGDFVRAYVLAKKISISKSSALGTIIIEVMSDFFAMITLAFVVFAVIDPPTASAKLFATLKYASLVTAVLIALLSIILYLFYRQVSPIVRFINMLLDLIPQKYQTTIRRILESLRAGFEVLNHYHHLRSILIWSLVIWTINGSINYFVFRAFDLQLPFIAIYVVMLSQVFAVMLPSAPGFIGVFHASTIAGLLLFGVDKELALSVSIVHHGIVYISTITVGMVFLWLDQFSFYEIQHVIDEQE